MTHTIWNLRLNQRKHTVELEHGVLSGKREIRVDGRKLELPPEARRQPVDYGSRHPFQLDGHDMVVVIRTNGVSFSYDLEVDGFSTKTGLPVDPETSRYTPGGAGWRAVNAVFLTLVGLVGFWWNARMAHTQGVYWPALAILSPLPLVFALLVGLYGEKLQQPPEKIPFGVWVLLAAALLLGLLNWYALENGWY